MLLCLSYYFVEAALCNKAAPSPQGSKYCGDAVFLVFSDSFLFFTSHNFYLPFCAWNFLAVVYFAHLTYAIRTLTANTNVVYGTSSFTFLSREIQTFIFQTYLTMLIKTLICFCYCNGSDYVYL